MIRTLDAPGSVCAFDSNGCSHSASGHGGFDEHHAWPISLGGAEQGPLLVLCPLHHRRQHALLRYLVEQDEADAVPDWTVVEHFTHDERQTASAALAQWRNAGRPKVDGWPCPAARA